MNHALAGIVLALVVLTSLTSAGQETMLRDSDAADRAGAIAVAASNMSILGADGPGASPERAMQLRIDEIAAVAATLESDIRASRDQAETRALYRRLKALASNATELAVHQGVKLDPAQVDLFEQMLLDLDRYYAQ